MAGAQSKDGVVHDQTDASVDDVVLPARSNLPQGESETHCEECDAESPEGKR